MSLPKSEAWFSAKTYGFGWSIPLRWQGWLVIFAFLFAIIGGAPLARAHLAYFLAYLVALNAGLILICIWKGEPARWRWGAGNDPPAK
jgi:hypothetical protein